MDTRRTLLVDAFTAEPLAGNPAGLVPDAEGLSDEQMQAVARELNASETAFLLPSVEADRRIRYFTPAREVDLCGHATIAAHVHLAAEGDIEPGAHTLETNVGVLDIEVEEDGTVWMTQTVPEVESVEVEYRDLAEALGCAVEALTELADDLPVARASTGAPYLVVPVNFLSALGGMDPDMAAVEALSDDYDVDGVYAFTFDTLSADATLHARMFAPAYGVPEDPVTGTASGACGAYLARMGALDTAEMTFEQGHFCDRPGRVRVRATSAEPPQVGGRATVAFDGTLVVPPRESDDILEA
jgi:trans-2,3-dihydro-3-hydroxyanthranilate isomerase